MNRPPLWIWIAGAALLPRLAWVLWNWSQHGPALAYPDEQLHWDLARNLVSDGALVSADGRHVARMPGYPAYLALFAAFDATGILAARVGQALLGALTAGLAARVAERELDPRCGFVAGLLVACDPFGIFFANLLLTEVLFTLLAVALADRWLRHLHDESATGAGYLLTGLLAAFALFVRPAAAPWLGLAILLTVAARGSVAARTRRVVLQTVPIVLLLVPWGLRNRAVVGDFAWLSGNGGVTLYDALGPQADGSSDQSFLADERWQGLGEIERDDALRDAAVAEVRANPARVVDLARAKFLRTWSLFPNVAEHRRGMTAWVSAVYSGLTLLLAAAGCLQLLRRNRSALLVWLLPILIFTLLHCVFIGSVRYRIPLMPFVAMLAGAAFSRPAEPRISIDMPLRTDLPHG